MREYEFYQVDVFTSERFSGNPLVVVPDADGLTTQEMKMIAAEMSVPQTTFVVAPSAEESLYRMRILTPTTQLPFTGHPAMGAHWVMAELGRVTLEEPVTTVRYEQSVGLLSADFHVKDGRLDHIMLDQCPPVFLAELKDVRDLARGLGVNPEDITGTRLPVQVVSTGMPQLMVPMRSLAAVQRLDASEMALASLGRVLRSLGSNFILVFTTETGRPDVTVHSRGFGHFVGIPEDPVTGNANGALGAYLVRNEIIPITEPTIRYIAEQGSEIQRPGTLIVEVDHENGRPRAVRVGGQVVQVMKGSFTI